MKTETALDLIEAVEYLVHLKAKGASQERLIQAAGVGHAAEFYGVMRFLRSVGVDVPKADRASRSPNKLRQLEPRKRKPGTTATATVHGAKIRAYYARQRTVAEPIEWNDLVRQVSARHGLSPITLLSPSKVPALVAARDELWHLARRHTRLSFPEIASLSGRDPVSVLHGARRHERRSAATTQVA